MKITFNVDTRPLLRAFDQLRNDQLPFATSVAINRTLRDSKDAVVAAVGQSFDRPTPWVMRGIGLEFSSKRNLRGVITLGTLGRSRVTTHHVLPGTRPSKGMELALQARGLLPSGMFVVPTSAAPRDAYGNVPRALIGQIMDSLGASKGAAGARAGRVRRKLERSGIEYFVGRPGRGLPAGIWEKRHFASGASLRPIFLFVRSADYRERLSFHDVVRRTVDARFADHFRQAWDEALRTAR